jgi:hypothetical protein
MIIIDSYLKNVNGMTVKEFNECNCVSCGKAFNETTNKPTELFFSHGQRIILLCPECKKRLTDLLKGEEEGKINL